jgi:enoyl-CoA hydratase/carnithine racemase|tara:strand:- start:181 stop:939 length:759 start_codon:yes stop_codon:yes gene_type:complete
MTNEDTSPLVFDDPNITGLRHIRLNNPNKLNVLNSAQQEIIAAAITVAQYDSAVSCLVFSGEGRAFCAGNDILTKAKALPEYRQHQVDLEIGSGPIGLHDLITKIRDFPKPTVVLMQGFALGAGYDIATSCDIRIATSDCKFGDPRVHRALWAAEGWSYKITRLIPQSYFSEMHLRGELLSGEYAMEIGLVHRTFNPDIDLRESASEILRHLASLPGKSYAMAKDSLLRGLDLRFEDLQISTRSHPAELNYK